jgi:site-specific DNA-methyltransferase (adenine-specific)
MTATTINILPRAGSGPKFDGVIRALDASYLGDELPDLAALVNWREAHTVPIHRWFRYREGFSPQLITALGLGDHILDPFCGSGSIMLGAAQLSRSAVGIDVNPLAAFASRVKLLPLTAAEIRSVRSFNASIPKVLSEIVPCAVPTLKIAEKVFEPEILNTLLTLRAAIEKAAATNASRDFLLLGWLSVLESVGSYFKEGNGIKYRNRKRLRVGYELRPDGEWQLARFGPDQRAFVVEKFQHQVAEMIADATAWGRGTWDQQLVIEGSSMKETARLDAGSFDSVIFSPPYANRFDYFESQKVELWFGGFVNDYQDMAALRRSSLRSHLGADLAQDTGVIPELETLIEQIDPASYAVRMRVPALLRGYFADMRAILAQSKRLLRNNGKCYIVVGNSAYGGVIIPTDSLIARIAIEEGFTRAIVHPVRHLTVAPQQRLELVGQETFMRESVVELA